jgi:hypothetical protein
MFVIARNPGRSWHLTGLQYESLILYLLEDQQTPDPLQDYLSSSAFITLAISAISPADSG